jgi:predicted metal-binding membrane protein
MKKTIMAVLVLAIIIAQALTGCQAADDSKGKTSAGASVSDQTDMNTNASGAVSAVSQTSSGKPQKLKNVLDELKKARFSGFPKGA